MTKVIVIGSGPAGYTAGLYLARASLKPLILAGEKQGGQLMNTEIVENWPGAEAGVMGSELMRRMREQAEKFGAEIQASDVTKVDFSKRPFKLWSKDKEYAAEAVVAATGAESRLLGVPGEKEYLGRGVSTCAVCDAPFFKDKTVVVVGGGDAAAEEALILTKFAKQVTMLVRRDELRASKIMAERLKKNEKIKISWNTELKEISGKEKIEAVKVVNNQTNKQGNLAVEGVFLAIGHEPVTGLFKGQLDLDEKNYIQIRLLSLGKEEWLNGYPTMTSVAGVFAAGDVVDFRYRQAVTAAGMGCMAALDVERWLGTGRG
jgi:thioredoxin reductase (NADPH)